MTDPESPPTGLEASLQTCGDCGGDLNHLDRAGSLPCRCDGDPEGELPANQKEESP